MSILDDDVFEQAERPITINLLKDVPDEDIPALLQAWYDVFWDAIVRKNAKGYEVYPILCLYEECFPNRMYRNLHRITAGGPTKTAYICKPSDRAHYINDWKQFMLSHVEDIINHHMPTPDNLFIALTGVFDCKELYDGDFRGPYLVLENGAQSWSNEITIPSPGHEHKYELYKQYIYMLLAR